MRSKPNASSMPVLCFWELCLPRVRDYASGTNHTLPTNGYAKAYSGVSLDSFIRKITFQEITPEGIQIIGPAIEVMAVNEQLDAHKNAVTVRLKAK